MNPRRMYETTFIVNAALEDATIDTIVNNTAEFIKNNGGTIKTLDKWGRRRLAYPIQKRNNGYYVYALYEAPASMLPQFNRFFQLEENIMRYLTVTMTQQALEYRQTFLQNRDERMIEPGTPRQNKYGAKNADSNKAAAAESEAKESPSSEETAG